MNDITQNTSSADPRLAELVNRYDKWRHIYTYAGQPACDAPVWESNRLNLREGYPHQDWTAYIVEPTDGGFNVLTATTERRNEPLEGLSGFFTDADDAGKYVIWNIGENLRVSLRLDPIEWAWQDAGLDPRVQQTSIEKFVSKYELKSDPSRYFILQRGGVQPENHLLPLTYDELDAQLLAGMPESVLSHL